MSGASLANGSLPSFSATAHQASVHIHSSDPSELSQRLYRRGRHHTDRPGIIIIIIICIGLRASLPHTYARLHELRKRSNSRHIILTLFTALCHCLSKQKRLRYFTGSCQWRRCKICVIIFTRQKMVILAVPENTDLAYLHVVFLMMT